MAHEFEKKTKRGGVRAGAGRPRAAIPTRTITLRLPEDLAARLDEYPQGRTAAVVDALRAYFGG